jgi:hypothetical protein
VEKFTVKKPGGKITVETMEEAKTHIGLKCL